MTKFPILVKTAQKVKHPIIPPIMPLRPYEEMVGWDTIGASYKNALRGQRKYTREAVLYDLFSEVNNVQLWRELTAIKARPDPDQRKKEYIPGSYRHRTITEPKERSLHIPKLRDKIVQTTVHEALQDIYGPYL